MRLSLIVVGVLLGLCTPAMAAGPAIGPLCIDGVTATLHPERSTPQDNGTWTPVDYAFDTAQAGRALVVVLDRSITPTDQLETCAATEKRMLANGAHTVLSGRVKSLKLSGQIFNGPGGNRFQIDPGAMELVLGRVDSGARPVIGGSIDFRGSRLWIGVTQTVLAKPDDIKGELDIEAYNRTITAGRIALGGLEFVADLAPARPSNVSVRLDLKTGQANLWAGNLTGRPKAIASGDLSFPYMSARGVALKSSRIDVTASGGKGVATFGTLSGKATSLSISNSPLTWNVSGPTISLGKAVGATDQSQDRLSVGDPELTGFAIPTATASLDSASGDTLFKGAVSATFADLGHHQRSGTSTWTSASSPVLSYLMPGGLGRVKWTEVGSDDALTVSGSLDLPQLSLGGMQLIQPLSMSLQPTRLASGLVIPVKVDLPSTKGSVSFLNADQTIGIEGRLDRLSIDGRLIIAVPALSSSRFEAKAGKVNLAVGAAVSISPVIAGAKPNFLNAEITASNLTDLSVAKAASTGVALLSTDALLLAQPVFKVGDNGTDAQATVSLTANGSAKLQYDLATSKTGIAQARLTADNVNFSLVGPGDKVVDFGGTLVTNPVGSIKQISVEVDRLSPIQIESAQLDTLSLSSGRVSKTPPAGSSELGYAGTPSRPLTLSSAHATRVAIDDKIALSLFSLSVLDFGVKDADVDFGSGIALAHSNLDLHAGRLVEAEVAGKTARQIQGLNVVVDGKLGVHTSGFSINDRVGAHVNLALDGPEDALNGAGSIGLGAFTGDVRSTLPIGFDCEGSHELDVDMETDVAFTGATINTHMRNGKLSGNAQVGPILAATHTVGTGTGCNAPKIHHVVAKQGAWWTDGICSKGLKFYHCRWESPEISYTYHISLNVRNITAPISLSNPLLFLHEDGNVTICNRGVVTVGIPVVFVGGYSPGIDSNYPGLDNIVNGIIQFTFEPAQSLAGSSLGNTAGWLVSTLATVDGNTFCFEKRH